MSENFSGNPTVPTTSPREPSEILQKIEKIASDVCIRENCELYDLEIVGAGNGRIVRVYIDKEDGSVGIEDCTNVSRGLNLILDVEDVIPGGAYNLEVSTPGLDRRLKKPTHFKRAVGKKIWIQLSQNLGSLGVQKASLQPTKKFEEVLKGFVQDTEHLEFEMQGELVKVPLNVVEKSKVVFEMTTGPKPKPGHGPKR